MADDVESTDGMVRGLYGPDVTFLGVPRAELGALDGLDVVFIGAPFDSGTSHRPGARFGPQAIRATDYLPHDGSRPHLALGVDPLAELRVADAGDVLMPPGDIEESLRRLEAAVLAVASGSVTVWSPPRITGIAPASATACTAASSRRSDSSVSPGGISTSPASATRSSASGSTPSARCGLDASCGR